MFREMVRKKQQLSREECDEVLRNGLRGVLAVLGDDDYPYAVPLNYYYDEESGNIYFHGGKSGHRIDAVKKHDKVSFCVYDEGYRREGEWALNIRSVIVFGRIRAVDDDEKNIELARRLSYKFTDDTQYIDKEIETSGPYTLGLEIVPEHITGKLVNES